MTTTETHDTVAICGTPSIILISSLCLPEPANGIVVGLSFLLAGLLLSPDLDLSPRSTVARRWGPFRHLWTPYGLLSSHRSKMTHSLLGTVLRMIYSAPFVLFPLLLLHLPIVLVLLGWFLSDISHYLLDRYVH